MKYHRVYSHPVPDTATGVGSDQSIALDGFYHCCPVDGGYDFSITLQDKGF